MILAKGSSCLRTLEKDIERQSLRIEGELPRSLKGRLMRAGVGKFEAFGSPIDHWFDGDGMAVSIDFTDDGIYGAARVLDVVPEIEKKKSKKLYGRFGFAPNSLKKRIKSIWRYDQYVNAGNTSVLSWQDRLLALYEGGVPTEFNGDDLSTIGSTDLGIVSRAFSAHPKYHERMAGYFNFGFCILPKPSLELYFLPDKGNPRAIGRVPFNGATFVHDFFITDSYFIFIVSPIFGDHMSMIYPGKPFSENLNWTPTVPTEIIVGRLDDPKIFQRFSADPILFAHSAYAFENGDEIIVNGVFYDDGKGFDWIKNMGKRRDNCECSPGTLRQARINLRKETFTVESQSSRVCEMPQSFKIRSQGEKNFTAAVGFLDESTAYQNLYECLHLFDENNGLVQTIDFGLNQAVSEVIFVDSNEDDLLDGYLLGLNYDSNCDRSYVAILGLHGNKAELLSRAWFDCFLPFTFHGTWKH